MTPNEAVQKSDSSVRFRVLGSVRLHACSLCQFSDPAQHFKPDRPSWLTGNTPERNLPITLLATIRRLPLVAIGTVLTQIP